MQGSFYGHQDDLSEWFIYFKQTKPICLLVFLPCCNVLFTAGHLSNASYFLFQSQVKWTKVFNFDNWATMMTLMFSMNADMIAERTSKGLSCSKAIWLAGNCFCWFIRWCWSRVKNPLSDHLGPAHRSTHVTMWCICPCFFWVPLLSVYDSLNLNPRMDTHLFNIPTWALLTT